MLLFETPFSADSYDTPENYPRSVWEYLTLGTRLSFYLRNFAVFAKVGKLCQQGKLTPVLQADYSVKNIRIGCLRRCGNHIRLKKKRRGSFSLYIADECGVIRL